MKNTIRKAAACLCVLALLFTMAAPALAAGVAYAASPASGVAHWSIHDDDYNTLDAQPVRWTLGADGTLSIRSAEDEEWEEFTEWDPSAVRSVRISPDVRFVAALAFDDCANLTSVTIPGSVTLIGDFAFSRCESLTGVELPAGVTSVGNYAFNMCEKLARVTLPDGLASIGVDAFYGTALTSVTLPRGLRSVKGNPFGFCESLSGVAVDAANPYLQVVKTADGSEMLLSRDGTQLFAVLRYGNDRLVVVPEGVTCIREDAVGTPYRAADYNGYDVRRTAVLPASISKLEENAFAQAERIIFTGTTPPAVEERAFSNMATSLVYFPAGARGAYEAALQNIPHLKCRTYAGEAEKQAIVQRQVFSVAYGYPTPGMEAYQGVSYFNNDPWDIVETGEVYTVKKLQELETYKQYRAGQLNWILDDEKAVLDNAAAYVGWADRYGTVATYRFGQQITVTKDLHLAVTKDASDVPVDPTPVDPTPVDPTPVDPTPSIPEQTIDARYDPARDHRYAYDVNGKQILGVDGESVVLTPEGDLYANGNIYYMNPDRDPNDPDSCYLMTNYVRVRPDDGGRTFYDADGISFYGWMHAEGGGMRFQTKLTLPGQNPYCIFVWHAQLLPSVQHPDHPGDPAYFLPAGWYLFDDNGVRMEGSGEYDFKYDVDQQMHHYTLTDGMITAIDGEPV